eukprot:6686988-Prymnesium_polylepis.1
MAVGTAGGATALMDAESGEGWGLRVCRAHLQDDRDDDAVDGDRLAEDDAARQQRGGRATR